jgi:class 3 adenylate cyclase
MREVPSFGAWLKRRRKALDLTQEALALIYRAVSGAAQPVSDAPTLRPSGTVTFLFTDIEASTPLWEREPDQMRVALARHDAILRMIIAKQGGQVYKTIGDAFQAAFAFPAQAVTAALAAQRALAAHDWETSQPLRVPKPLPLAVCAY